jgi:TPR repeat protein
LPSKTQLGYAHYFGHGVPIDLTRGCQFLVDAARLGDSWAFDQAGRCLVWGEGVPRDRLAGCTLTERALEEGTGDATTLEFMQTHC